MSSIYEIKFLIALILTIGLEFLLALFLRGFIFYFKDLKKIKLKKLLFVFILSSSLTLPYLWFVLPVFITSKISYILICEIIAIFSEAILYWQFLKIRFMRGLILSFLSNLFSFFGGKIVFYFIC